MTLPSRFQCAKRKVSILLPLSLVVARYSRCSASVIEFHLRSRTLWAKGVRNMYMGRSIVRGDV